MQPVSSAARLKEEKQAPCIRSEERERAARLEIHVENLERLFCSEVEGLEKWIYWIIYEDNMQVNTEDGSGFAAQVQIKVPLCSGGK